MATNNDRVLVAQDAELWIDGLDMRPTASRIMVGPQSVSTVTTRLSDTVRREQSVQLTGNAEVQVYEADARALAALNEKWIAAVRGEYIYPIMWSRGQGFNVGEQGGATFITPKAFPVSSANAEAAVQRTYMGTWQSKEIFGEIQSSQTADGRHAIDSPLDSDFALLNINTIGPDIYSDTVAISNGTGKHVAVQATVKAVIGHGANPPVLTLDLPSGLNDWRGQYVPPNAHGNTIHITHRSVTRGVPILGGDTVQRVLDTMGELRWPDGFRVTAVRANNQITITGSHAGANEDIILPNTNLEPFRGSVSGTGDIRTQFRIVSATGSGGSRVYTELTELYDCDAHHTPVTAIAILPEGAEQLGIQVVVPTATTPYNYQLRYNLAYIVDEVD